MSDHPTLPFGESEPPERWLPVVGYEGLYSVSDLGRVRSFQRHNSGKRGGLLKPMLAGTPPRIKYYMVALYRGGVPTTRAVHILVAEAFLGPRPEGHEVCHGPAGPQDNRLVNIRWGTVSENALDRRRDGTAVLGERQHASRLTPKKVAEIRVKRAAGVTFRALAREYGVANYTICQVVSRKTWQHVA